MKCHRRSFPLARPNDAIEPLESPARNLLICNGVSGSLCGLRALDGERGPRKECVERWVGWPTGEVCRRDPRQHAGIVANR